MKKEENIFKQLISSIGGLFKRLFGFKEEDILVNEDLMSPREMITKNFFRNKLAVFGLIIFTVMALTVTVGSALFPVNYYDSEPALAHTAPGRKFLKVPSKLQSEGVKEISSGVSFSFGVSEKGNLHFWGVDTEQVKNVPEELKNEKIAQVAAGNRHVIVLTEEGKLHAWGLNTFEQGSIPLQVSQTAMKEKVKRVFAGDLYSGILTEKGKAYIWGSTLNNKLDMVPSAIQERIVDLQAMSANVLYLLDDGTVAVNGLKGNPVEARIPEHLTDGSTNVVQIAATTTNAIAIDDQGKLHLWGTSSGPVTVIPEGLDGNVAKIVGSKGHFTALKTDGSIVSWGENALGQTNTAKLDGKSYEDVFSTYYQSYAVDGSNKATGYGFEGFLLGSDDWGRDVAVRLIHGGRITMFVGIIAVFISTFIGVTVGLIAGFYGGRIDNVLMRIAEIVSSFPFLPLAITLSTMLSEVLTQSQRLFMVMIILGVISWPGLARMIRGQILAEREKDFVLAAQALGLSTNKIIVKHILPAVFNIIIVTMTLSYAGNLLTESGLSFLGFGVAAPQPSWGNMLTSSQSAKVIEFYWWEWVLPAFMVLMAALSINLVGDGLRDAMDPKTSDH